MPLIKYFEQSLHWKRSCSLGTATGLLILHFFLSGCILPEHTDTRKLRAKAWSALEEKDLDAAFAAASKASESDRHLKDTAALAESLYLLSRTSALSGQFEEAIHYGQEAAELCRMMANYSLEYKINNTLSWAYFETNYDFKARLTHQDRQLFVVEQLNDDQAKALVYNNYGYDRTVAGNLPLEQAIRYMKIANDHYAKTEKNNGRWYTLMNLTWQYRLKGDFQTSETYGQLAVQQAAADQDRHAIIEANTNLGETLLAQNKLTEAKPLYVRAQKWSQQEADRDKFVFDVYFARYLWLSGRRDQAIAELEKAVSFLSTGEVFYEMLGRAWLAEFYRQTNQNLKAAEQIKIIENPRSNYVSFETQCLAVKTQSKLQMEMKPLVNTWIAKAETIGAHYLVELLKK